MSVKVPAEKNFRRAKSVKSPVRSKKTARRSIPWRAASIVAAGVLGLYSTYRAFDLVVHASALKVSRIAVHGNARITSGEVRALLDGVRGSSILTADLSHYRARLMESPWVADVALRRILPSTIEVLVSEREPIGLCRLNGRLYLVDATGWLIEEFGPQHADFNLPIINGAVRPPASGEPEVDEHRVELAARLLASLEIRKDLASRISEIDVSNPQNAVVLLRDDPALLHLGDEKFVERLHAYVELASTLRKSVPDMDYVDLRFDEHIYVGPNGAGVKKVASRPPAGN